MSTEPSGYPALVTRRLFLVEDDLLFAQRARAAAARLGATTQTLTPQAAADRTWEEGDVVLLQATLRPERQEQLIEQLMQRKPAPIVVAVTGHLETELRKRLRAHGARLAAHSSMDRTLARALGLSGDAGDRDDDDLPPSPS